ncbi:MAG: hypothetical protein V1703_03770 [Candidatus Altiarchaeota archaeon]
MKRIHFITLGIVLVILLAMPATAAEKSKSIIDKIIDFIKGIIDSIMGKKTTTTRVTTTTQARLCNPPYIQVGKDCCKDSNSNGVCDKDEVTTTTTTTSTSTTTSSTTTRITTTEPPTTTTTTLNIACTQNADCGTELRLKVCYTDGDIYWVTDFPVCQKPGTPEARCIIKRSGPAVVTGQIISEKAEDCPGSCKKISDTEAQCLS